MKRTGRYSFSDKVAHTAYTPEHDRIIMQMASDGEPWYKMSERLQRTEKAVQNRFHVLRRQMGPQAV